MCDCASEVSTQKRYKRHNIQPRVLQTCENVHLHGEIVTNADGQSYCFTASTKNK